MEISLESVALDKPMDVFDRDVEWADLIDFALSPRPGLRIAVVYGRRRQGKSYLLRRLSGAVGGLYHLATEQVEPVSLRRFGDSLATWAGLSAGAFGFGDWEQALLTATETMAMPSRSRASRSGPPLLVLDEFPYLAQETPGLPSIVQALYDRLGPGAGEGTASFRLILCGSAISVMANLLSGTRALRGRAALELRVRSFGYRDAREYWGISDPAAAFAHNAIVGGTPGYRELVQDPQVPEDPAQLGGWLARNVLRPSMPLFDEARRVVHEDPRIRDTAAYSSVLAAVAAGESSPTKIGGLLGRPARPAAARRAHQRAGSADGAGVPALRRRGARGRPDRFPVFAHPERGGVAVRPGGHPACGPPGRDRHPRPATPPFRAHRRGYFRPNAT
jgi:uncharacterized protein